MIDVISEKDRRLSLWHSISNGDLENIAPNDLRSLGIYGGAQGIWVDKTRTASPEIGSDGATVATSRPPARDAAEVQATKNAMSHRLPIFVVLHRDVSRIMEFHSANHRCLCLLSANMCCLHQLWVADVADGAFTPVF